MFDPDHFRNLPEQEARFERVISVFCAADQERARQALAFARSAHAGQLRKGTWKIPYIIHPIRTACSIVDEFHRHDVDAVITALLHDALEDCPVTSDDIARAFGATILAYVQWMTWEKGLNEKWRQARAMLRAPPSVRIVKASDVLDNARATWAIDSREEVLRLLYGYSRWGMPIAESVSPEAVQLLRIAFILTAEYHFVDDPVLSSSSNRGKELAIAVTISRSAPGAIGERAQERGEAIRTWDRYPIRTHIVTPTDDVTELVRRYTLPHLQPDDLLAISERVVAITQGRAYPLADITPSWWAKLLVRFVTKNPAGIGLASPWTMELAIHEAGLPRLLFAAAVAAVTKPFGIRGMFYRFVGHHINAIDGPCDYTLAPFGAYAKLGPKDPDRVATYLARTFGVDVAIIDANDLGVNVLGASEGVHRRWVEALFRDNPLGQTDEQTPLCIVRASVETEKGI